MTPEERVRRRVYCQREIPFLISRFVEKEAMVAKLKSQKRATVGTTGAALQRSKSAQAGVSATTSAEDKREALKQRLESFNKLKKDDAGDSAAAGEEELQQQQQSSPRKTAVAPLRKAHTEQQLKTRPAGDALLDKDSSDEELPPPVKKSEYSVGDKLEAVYTEDGLW